jgi:hypothetical protein
MPFTASPYKFDSQLIIGDTWQPAEVALLDDAGDPYDLTGATGECEVRSSPGSTLLLTATVSHDGAGGVLTWVASAALTAALSAQTARYSVRLTFADATVRTVVVGTVHIVQEIVA